MDGRPRGEASRHGQSESRIGDTVQLPRVGATGASAMPSGDPDTDRRRLQHVIRLVAAVVYLLGEMLC